jgi:crossover junction endodeoxyribonuclease RusA
MNFEFIIPKRPVSSQTKKRNSLNRWKNYVRAEAEKHWQGELSKDVALHLTLGFFYKEDILDVDNIVKPIQDALVGLVYEDDALITDLLAHRHRVSALYREEESYPVKYSDVLIRAILLQSECVYVRVQDAGLLEGYL